LAEKYLIVILFEITRVLFHWLQELYWLLHIICTHISYFLLDLHRFLILDILVFFLLNLFSQYLIENIGNIMFFVNLQIYYFLFFKFFFLFFYQFCQFNLFFLWYFLLIISLIHKFFQGLFLGLICVFSDICSHLKGF